jgi:hypothetical protein
VRNADVVKLTTKPEKQRQKENKALLQGYQKRWRGFETAIT